MARLIVEVMLKPEIHDPQGEAILGACHRLGFGQVRAVRQGKRFEVEIDGPADDAAVAAVQSLAHELLANPVIEDSAVHPALRPPRDADGGCGRAGARAGVRAGDAPLRRVATASSLS